MKHRETLGPIGTLGSKTYTLPPSSGFQRELPRKVVSYSFLRDVAASLDDGSENQECTYIISATANIYYTHTLKLFKSRILVCCLTPPKSPSNSTTNALQGCYGGWISGRVSWQLKLYFPTIPPKKRIGRVLRWRLFYLPKQTTSVCKCIPWKKIQWLRFLGYTEDELCLYLDLQKAIFFQGFFPVSFREWIRWLRRKNAPQWTRHPPRSNFQTSSSPSRRSPMMIFVFSFTLCLVSRFGNGQPLRGKLQTTNIAGKWVMNELSWCISYWEEGGNLQ